MARGLTVSGERPRAQRHGSEATPWLRVALLRPGQEVMLLNVSTTGVLVESKARMLPGARADLQLFGPRRRLVHGRIVRCRVASLQPLKYEGAIMFDHALDAKAAGSG
jgi:hypothetical protein